MSVLVDRFIDAGRRLAEIAAIVEAAEDRAAACCSWPICSTREELTDKELAEIYRLAKGPPQNQKEMNVNSGAVEAERRSPYS